MFSTTSLLCWFGADQVARVCEMLEGSGDVERLARFLWSLPADEHIQAELERHESVVRARALVAYHAGNFTDLFHQLASFHFTQAKHTSFLRTSRLYTKVSHPVVKYVISLSVACVQYFHL